jgi:tRNA A-37 threonylcarbamoyl transferase component Bud32
MRGVQRLTRNLRSEWYNRARKAEVRRSVQSLVGEPVTFSLSGSRGADSIFVIKNLLEKKIGVLRLLNPYRKLKTTIEGAPYVVLEGSDRIARELKSYELGSSLGLTPKVIWAEKDALLCEYFAGYSGFELYQCGKLDAVRLMDLGWQTLRSAHDIGLTHMDASIQNILISGDFETAKLVDFEFGAADHMTFNDQCVYDFLRYLESSLKFLDKSSRKAVAEFVSKTDVFDSFSQDIHSIEKLKPALTRLTKDHDLWIVVQSKMGVSV